MESIERKLFPWNAQDRSVGAIVYACIVDRLDAALWKAYSSAYPEWLCMPPDLLDNERKKFRLISQGDFTPEYFAEQGLITRHNASRIDVMTYLCPGYANYASALASALIGSPGCTDDNRDVLIDSLMKSVFSDVSVAMHHYFAEFAEQADREREAREEARRARDAAAQEAASMRSAERRLRCLLQNASDTILIADAEGHIAFRSATLDVEQPHTDDAVSAQSSFIDTVHPADQEAMHEVWQQVLAVRASSRTVEARTSAADGSWRHSEVVLTNRLDEPAVNGVVLTVRDIEERKEFERQLTQRAFYDALTGLPNRALFHDRLDRTLMRSGRRRSRIGLIFIDLDNFKLINDGLGHDAGDQLLKEVARRLSTCGRAEDTVARLGGDEFVIVFDCIADEIGARTVADNVVRQFKRPFQLGHRNVFVTASVGLVVGDSSKDTPDTLLRDADIAMYNAKTGGKGRYVVFDTSMQIDSLARLELETDLREALNRDELVVHYQPIVDLETGRLLEFEALVRWRHPRRGLLSPAEFIPIAEETGLIVPLGTWVLGEACRQLAAWRRTADRVPSLAISVNLSPRQFLQPDLDRTVASILDETGIAPALLKLEITETTAMRDFTQTLTILHKLKALGVQIALDDFGTGYSSLAYLKMMPLDVIKIDRAFVSGIGKNPEDTAIVQAIMSLAKSLNLSVTGEGIETAEQARVLASMACERGQGYFYAKPIDFAAPQTLSGSSVVVDDLQTLYGPAPSRDRPAADPAGSTGRPTAAAC